MKKMIALITVLVMVLSFSTVAFAANSPIGSTTSDGGTSSGGTTAPAKPVEVEEPSTEGKAALEAAVEEELKGMLKEGETTKVIATFSAKKAGKVEANAAGVKAGDVVYVLFRTADGKIRVLKAIAKDGKISFNAPGAGDFTIVLVDGAGDATVPSTGDSNRMMKLVLAGAAAILVMSAAGVAIKRTNS